jgi:hypothetical protein
MLDETYQNDGISDQTSLPNPDISIQAPPAIRERLPQANRLPRASLCASSNICVRFNVILSFTPFHHLCRYDSQPPNRVPWPWQKLHEP